MKIGHKLKELRNKNKHTLRSVADILNMSETNYSKIERNEISISMDNTEKLAKHYNLKIDELLNNDGVTLNISNNNEVNAGYHQSINKLNDEVLKILKQKEEEQKHRIEFLEKELTEKNNTIKKLLKKLG